MKVVIMAAFLYAPVMLALGFPTPGSGDTISATRSMGTSEMNIATPFVAGDTSGEDVDDQVAGDVSTKVLMIDDLNLGHMDNSDDDHSSIEESILSPNGQAEMNNAVSRWSRERDEAPPPPRIPPNFVPPAGSPPSFGIEGPGFPPRGNPRPSFPLRTTASLTQRRLPATRTPTTTERPGNTCMCRIVAKPKKECYSFIEERIGTCKLRMCGPTWERVTGRFTGNICICKIARDKIEKIPGKQNKCKRVRHPPRPYWAFYKSVEPL